MKKHRLTARISVFFMIILLMQVPLSANADAPAPETANK